MYIQANKFVHFGFISQIKAAPTKYVPQSHYFLGLCLELGCFVSVEELLGPWISFTSKGQASTVKNVAEKFLWNLKWEALVELHCTKCFIVAIRNKRSFCLAV